YEAESIHGMSTAHENKQGVDILYMMEEFKEALSKAKFVVCQNVQFDLNVMGAEFLRYGMDNILEDKPKLDTCTEVTAELVKLPGGRGGRDKLPTLTELHAYLFGVAFSEEHNATADGEGTNNCGL